MNNKKVILIIMDGWGLGKVASADAIQHAKTPFVSSLYQKYPNTTLTTCGEAVGLPEGQMGNSEVGHLNLGAGRIVYQELQRINAAVRDGSFAKNENLLHAIRLAKKNQKPLHLVGLVSDEGDKATDALQAIKNSYAKNITDEFIKPCVIVDETQQPLAKIKDGDVVICFNFRTDRCREITQVLTQIDLPDFGMKKLSLDYTTMTEYDRSFKNIHIIFSTDNLNNTIGEVLEHQHLKQIRIAETEKYPHVTFFFSGGREIPFEGEIRILIPSLKVATYDLKPDMSAYEVTDALLPEIKNQTADFICLNFANADMVGHTGFWEAAIKAVETVDRCVEKVVTTGLENGYTTFLTADHGNSDYMINEDGTPNTAHTLNPVPFFIIDNEWRGKIKPGKLADVAPTILSMMDIPIPQQMTGEILTDKLYFSKKISNV